MSLPLLLSQPYVLGIDEAGRGPVLGPMVYAYAACPLSARDELASMGFADSKALNAAQREALLAALQQSVLMRHHTIVLSPQSLSADMQRASRVSLNVISHDAAIALIHHALDDQGLRLAEVYVDTVGDPTSYAAKLQALFPDIRITVSAKADSLFPIVSAASIVAKCARDDAIQRWAFSELDTDTGAVDDAMQPKEAHQPQQQRSGGVRSVRKRRMAERLDTEGSDGDDGASSSADEAGAREDRVPGTIDRDMGSGYPGGREQRTQPSFCYCASRR